jgi:hypothetical protein
MVYYYLNSHDIWVHYISGYITYLLHWFACLHVKVLIFHFSFLGVRWINQAMCVDPSQYAAYLLYTYILSIKIYQTRNLDLLVSPLNSYFPVKQDVQKQAECKYRRKTLYITQIYGYIWYFNISLDVYYNSVEEGNLICKQCLITRNRNSLVFWYFNIVHTTKTSAGSGTSHVSNWHLILVFLGKAGILCCFT